jgi:tetratricopeptide (TPR) repeat protein
LADNVDRRLNLCRRAASLQLEAGNPEATVQTLGTALTLREDDPEVLEVMDRALVALGHHDELRRVLALRAELAVEDEERVTLLRRLAKMHEEVLAQPEEAAQVWRKLLEVSPDDGEALQRLSQSYEASGSTEELVEVLQRRIDASADGDERRSLRFRLASLHREASKDRPAEIDVLRELLTEAPSDDEALSALGRALIADERYVEAADVLQDRATIAEGEERRAGLLLEAARLYRGPLEDGVGALERYAQVLDLSASSEGAIADLVEMVGDANLSGQVAALLRGPLTEQGRHGELATLLAARARLSDDPDEVAESLRQLAAIRYERLGDPQGALTTTMELAMRGPVEESAAVLEAARRLAAEIGEVQAHVAALDEASAATDDPMRRARFCVAAADTVAALDADNAGAAQRLAPLLESGAADLALCLRLEHYAGAAGNAELEEGALSRAASVIDPDSESPTQLELWVRLGSVRARLQNYEGASDAFRDALEAEVGHGPALAGMENILQVAGAEVPDSVIEVLEEAYAGAGNPDGLAYLARLRLDRADEADRSEILTTLGGLVEQGSGTVADALEIWGALLASDAESATGLDKMREAAGNPELLTRAAELSAHAVSAARDQSRGAGALTLLSGQLLLASNADPQSILALLGPELEDSETPELLEVAVEAARRAGEPRNLHDLLRRAARSVSEPQLSAAAWREAAAVAETALDEPALAIEDLRELIDADETDAAGWDKLGALLAASEDFEALGDHFERRLDVTAAPEAQRELRYRLANLLVEKLERPEDAINIYNDMIMAAPDDHVAAGELELVLRKLDKWDEVRELVEGKLEHAEGEAKAELYAELAKVCEERLEERNDAIGIWQRALAELPGLERGETELRRLFEAEERWRDLAELSRVQMDRSRDEGDNELFRERASDLAGLLAQRLDAQSEAEEILEGLLEVDPTYVPALVALASVYEARGSDGEAKETLERAAALGPTGAAGAKLHLKLADLSEDAAVKRSALSKALECEPGNPSATRQLLELARSDDSWEDVVRLLEMSVVGVSDKDERRKVQLERVDVMYDRLGDIDGGLRVLHSVYEEVKDDVEVNRRIADGLYRLESWEQAGGMYSWLVEVSEGKRSKELASYLTRLANIEANIGQLENASAHRTESHKMDTTNPETLVSLGIMYQAQQEWAEALKIYRAMLLQNADRSGRIRRGDIYLSLAKIHVALEESPKALAMLRRGVEEDSEHAELGQMLSEMQG